MLDAGSYMFYLFTQDGNTALLLACLSGRLNVAQWLVSSAGSNAVTERDNVRMIPQVLLLFMFLW